MKESRKSQQTSMKGPGAASQSLMATIRDRGRAMKAEELAELLSLTSTHIYKMAAAGRIPSFRIGGAVRFDPYVVADWLDRNSG